MRTIDGYVAVGEFNEIRTIYMLYGKGKEQDFCALSLNDITPYDSIDEALKGCHALLKFPDLVSAMPAKIKMVMAESVKELERFKKKSGLIIIANLDGGVRKLIGPSTKTLPRELGNYLGDINFMTYIRKKGEFSPYGRAIYVLSEINRQAQSPATIATFKLKRLKQYKVTKK